MARPVSLALCAFGVAQRNCATRSPNQDALASSTSK
eukprot:CAMPEP_0171080710 /NCGR_PEP_ID=MMETSP0766_2-20121228/16036_1 /TAXON_ID=439317 /ORGANISM="Gambierdiscus australes, Strain CAWD 149" /LENGTH=35 /DNA_ID= /DNA_START= /DNA_END= /DNA_ORIENTATION=